MKLLYCYILFLDERGEINAYRGMDHIELNLSATDKFTYDVKNNLFQRENRKAPLPDHFWADNNTTSEFRNLYNVNVIAGQNGSGKTTAMRCVMNLLDFFYGAAHGSRSHESTEMSRHRALLLLEENGIQYLLDYAPKRWMGNSEFKTEGFHIPPQILSCKDWDTLSLQRETVVKEMMELLRKTKVIYLSNTLTQYDYERHLGEENGRRRDTFMYDASIGASIGQDIAQYFLYEVYKQVQYVFDPIQEALRRELQAQTKYEIILPHALRLRLRVEPYREAFSRKIFPAIAAAFPSRENEGDAFRPGDIDLLSLLGMLCAAAYKVNLEQLANRQDLSLLRYWPIEKNNGALLPRMEFNMRIKETEKRFYYSIGPLTDLREEKRLDFITCITVFPDGRVVSGSQDHTLQVWDPTTGDRLQTWKGYANWITCIAVLPDGRVVSGSDDHNLRVWDSSTGQCLQTLRGHALRIACVAVLPDGRVVSGSWDKTLRVWNPTTGDCLQILEGHTDLIRCVAVLPDGQVVSGSWDKTLRVWNPTTGDCLQTLKGHTSSINCVAVLPDGRVVSGSWDNTLRVWNPVTGRYLQTLEGHTSGINCVAVLLDGRIVSGSWDKTLRVWNPTTGDCLQTLKGHTNYITCVAVLPDGRVVSESQDNSIRIWVADIEQARKEQPAANDLMKNCLAYVNFLYEHYESLFSLFQRIDDISFELSLDSIWPKSKDNAQQKSTALDSEDAYSLLMDFMRLYLSVCQPAYTIDFDWGLSSGEENMLRMFSDLYHIFDWRAGSEHKIYNVKNIDQKKECETILVFMDEADLTLHPEWQRRLIDILTCFLPRIYPTSCARSIQLILSTHSPLILGDIPSENIIYLFKNVEEESTQPLTTPEQKKNSPVSPPFPGESFGQNIHTLLKENFFLEKGTVGAFAARKINELADRLFALKKQVVVHPEDISTILAQLPELRQMIRLVAPGVLRTQLDILLRDVEDQIQPKEHAEIEQLLKVWKALPPEKRQATLKFIEEGGKQQ